MTGDRGDLLVVDDTPSNLLLLGELLRGKGYRVRMAPEGELALQAARSRYRHAEAAGRCCDGSSHRPA